MAPERFFGEGRPLSENHGVGIEIRDVNLSYGSHHVLKNINLRVHPGEIFAFLGPSGCGKTTLLRLIAGFNQAASGQVLLGDEDIAALPPWKRDVGMVFQSYALWPHMTVAKNVAFGLEERRLPRAQVASRVKAALELVGLQELGARYPSQLSGGQQQRVAVARTIAIEPKVLLLDEPLSNLDTKMRVQVRRELRDLQRRLCLTTIFVTHDQEEANSICDRIAVMNDGVIQHVGTPIELYEAPANLFVANFLGTANILEGRVVGEAGVRAFEVAGGARVALAANAPVSSGAKLVFRPQHAALGPSGSSGLAGTIVHREFLGSIVRYGVNVGRSEILVEMPFISSATLKDLGENVAVTLVPERALFLAA
ncbi:MAG: ABC transporter ATP-binding protein [Proteobacteria bacterium]|nr:ABC transporter ATP-binding protein [Pseudomonadota bacterium]